MPHYRESENGNRVLVKIYPEDLVSMIIPDRVTTIGRGAFNSLTSVVIPDSVTTIGLSAALSNNESLFAAPAPAEERETKRQSPAVASRVGLFSSEAVSDNSHLETKMPDEPRPAP